MKCHVRLFARARELAGADHVAVEMPEGATVADLRRELVALCPPLADLMRTCAVAVVAEFATDTVLLTEADEIALLPPVSGG